MHKKDLSGQAKYLGVMSLKDFILYFYSKRGCRCCYFSIRYKEILGGVKMKRFLKFLCMCLIMSMAESAHAALPTVKDTVIISTADRKAVTLAEMAENFVDYDVVFFGEFHDQDVLHELEYEMLQQLYAIHGDKLVLSLEMFEADNQSVLNEYLDGKITEDEFLAKSRPWPRYKTDYRQLVEFAKTHKLPVLASNIPRFLAANWLRGHFSCSSRAG